MKAVMIVCKEAFTKEVQSTLESHDIRGFTMWQHVQGQGMDTGKPHMGTHAWPELNSVLLSVLLDEDKVDELLAALNELDDEKDMKSIHAFVWTVDQIL